MAGVQHDQIGLLGGFGRGVTVGFQRFGHALGIIDIHLTAERLYQNFFGSGHCRILAFLLRSLLLRVFQFSHGGFPSR